jgi:iron complex transport system ATP-binding protein
MSDERLSAEEVRFNRGKRAVLAGASLAFGPGDVVSLLGANGAGKTTLLRLMLGLQRPHGGRVLLGHRTPAEIGARDFARRVAYVPQLHHTPFPYRVREVVALGRLPAQGLFGPAGSADADMVSSVLDHLGILPLAERPYTQLSGGERQLVIIARALIQGARLLVLDEPLSGLDFGNQVRLLERLKELAETGYGVLLTTHDPHHAVNASTRVAVLIGGRIAEDGPPDEVVTHETIHRLYGVRLAATVRGNSDAEQPDTGSACRGGQHRRDLSIVVPGTQSGRSCR